MVNDPYQVLGVPHGASQDEIKRAYRKKAKECHPDLHPDDPDARRKMQEANEAYDMLMNPEKYQNRQQYRPGGSQQGSPYGQGNPYGQYGGWQTGGNWADFEDLFGFGRSGYYGYQTPPREEPQDSDTVRRVVYYINSRQYQYALTLLNGMPGAERNARWHYLSALTHQGMGNTMAAMDHAQRAVQMEPDNALYQQLLQQYHRAGQTYQQNARGYNTTVFGANKLCLGLCLSQLFCRFCLCC
ncbi:MAG: DnaJ domain-containing protein [Clostridia bacterium]|nr:DnaJ domain-containing protein [Clostridia bacterium]